MLNPQRQAARAACSEVKNICHSVELFLASLEAIMLRHANFMGIIVELFM
jgi:hypothetical protein